MANNEEKTPNVICFTEEQLLEMKECAINGSVIGVDRTFNLGACYVTSMVYTNPNMLKKGKGTSPVMLGPVFLHWDGAYATYCEFFSKVRSSLGFDLRVEKLTFGTDEELALVNAIKTAFPGANHILCARHLQENANRNFSKFKIPDIEKNRIINAIFSPSGLLSSNSRVMYMEKEKEILESLEGNLAFNYLAEKLLPTIKDKVYAPRVKNPQIPLLWKNNFC